MKYKLILGVISLLASIPHCWHFMYSSRTIITWIPHARLPMLLLRSYFPTTAMDAVIWQA